MLTSLQNFCEELSIIYKTHFLLLTLRILAIIYFTHSYTIIILVKMAAQSKAIEILEMFCSSYIEQMRIRPIRTKETTR